jgi:predicted nucleotidyltransferase
MTIADTALEVASFLESIGVSYAILGGLAVQHWGEPRNTNDVDLVVMVTPDATDAFLTRMLSAFGARIPDAMSFAKRNRVLLAQSSSGVPLDVSLGIPGYEEEVMRRIVRVPLGDSGTVRMISAEDLLIHKAVAGRPRDIEDIEGVLVRARLKLDMSYIRRWLKEFADLIDERDVAGDFERAVREAQRRLKEAL